MLSSRRMRACAATITIVAAYTLVMPGAEAAPAKCFGKKPTIVGTKNGDVLRGTDKADVIVGLGGDDRLIGKGKGDRLCGGGGSDELLGGPGDDRANGGSGNEEVLFGDEGNDILRDTNGFEHFFVPGEGDDEVTGSTGGLGALNFVSFVDSPAAVVVDLTAGTATGEGTDVLSGIDSAETTDFADTVTGTDDANFLFTHGGDDTIRALGGPTEGDPTEIIDLIGPGLGTDTVEGGEGLDAISFEDAAAGVTLDIDTQEVSGGESDAISGIEAGNGSPFADTFLGDENLNGFQGLGGDDTIDGRGGTDFVVFFDATNPVTVDLAAGTSSSPEMGDDTLSNIEDVFGSDLGDDISGTDGPNAVYAGGGDDTVAGLGGADALVGDDGNDTMDGGAGDDDLDGDEGDDALIGGDGDDSLDGGPDEDTLDGGDGSDECLQGENNSNCESEPPADSSHLPHSRVWAGRPPR